MRYGKVEKVMVVDNEGSTASVETEIHDGNPIGSFVKNTVRVKVLNAKQEMQEYIEFSDRIRAKRISNKLYLKYGDPDTMPKWTVTYSKNHDYYFVTKFWCEKME